ncbi:alpha/beta hydrolase [Nocardia sp. NBC_00511]|uniref:alpha/beta hydrolase n=1 Tax=Nocardia sp. NBC_00511 TaxID=2903591 RepID=UPI0030E12EC6
MRTKTERVRTRFTSGDIECAAWHYPGTNGACVVMAPGGAVDKEPGTDPFARRFHDAGFTVLAFDFRRFGESGGQPRQLVRMREQRADFEAAIAHAATLPEVTGRIAIWGFSLAGGHVVRIAARHPGIAAAIAQTPLVDGPRSAARASRHQRPLAMLRFLGLGLLDALGGIVGRAPILVPLAGAPGTVAMLTTPDGLDGDRALNPGNRYPDWLQAIAARSGIRISLYRPGRYASAVAGPLLVLVADQDRTAPPEFALRVAHSASHAELARVPGGHYAPFLDAHEQAVEAELVFLRGHLLSDG